MGATHTSAHRKNGVSWLLMLGCGRARHVFPCVCNCQEYSKRSGAKFYRKPPTTKIFTCASSVTLTLVLERMLSSCAVFCLGLEPDGDTSPLSREAGPRWKSSRSHSNFISCPLTWALERGGRQSLGMRPRPLPMWPLRLGDKPER